MPQLLDRIICFSLYPVPKAILFAVFGEHFIGLGAIKEPIVVCFIAQNAERCGVIAVENI